MFTGDLSNSFLSELCFQKLTVGKIYAGLLILENYRAKKSGTEVEMIFLNFVFLSYLQQIVKAVIIFQLEMRKRQRAAEILMRRRNALRFSIDEEQDEVEHARLKIPLPFSSKFSIPTLPATITIYFTFHLSSYPFYLPNSMILTGSHGQSLLFSLFSNFF